MAYRMRIRRRVPARSRLGRRYAPRQFRPTTAKRLKRMARAGKWKAHGALTSELQGSGTANKQYQMPIFMYNRDPTLSFTFKQLQWKGTIAHHLVSGSNWSAAPYWGIGIYRRSRYDDSATDAAAVQAAILARIYFPGQFTPDKSEGRSFVWLKRAEGVVPTQPATYNSGRANMALPFKLDLRNIRVPPRTAVGLAFWMVEDFVNTNIRVTLDSMVRLTAQTDAGDEDTNGVDDICGSGRVGGGSYGQLTGTSWKQIS